MEDAKELTMNGPIAINTSKIVWANLEAILPGNGVGVAVQYESEDGPTYYRDGDAASVASIIVSASKVAPDA